MDGFIALNLKTLSKIIYNKKTRIKLTVIIFYNTILVVVKLMEINPEACQGCDDVVCCTNRSTKTPYVPPRGHHWKLETG